LDVPDEQSARLVILRPEETFRGTSASVNRAVQAAESILNNRGTAPRIYRNMLAFVAPDQDLMSSLKQEVRRYLAWQSVKQDSEVLNLDAAQNRETDNNLGRSNETVELRIKEAYCWLLVPYVDRNVDLKIISWDTIRISGGNESIVAKAARKMIQNEALITKWAPALLLMELDQLLWREDNHIQIKKLWEYLCTYCYLPRLAGYEVLEDTIRTGVHSTEYFALAAGVGENRYLDFKFNQSVTFVDRSSYLVKIVPALKQIAEMQTNPSLSSQPYVQGQGTSTSAGTNETATEPYSSGGNVTVVPQPGETQPAEKKNTRFYLSAKLDTTRINRDVQRLVEEVISHLTSVDGCQVEVSLEVNARIPDGLPHQTVRVVTENCRTLKVNDFGFED
jgi:hypothetical protein